MRAWAAAHGIPWHERRQTGVIRRLARRDGWARHWDQQMRRPLVPAPLRLMAVPGIDPGTLPPSHAWACAADPCPGRQRGGRAAGEATLRSFLDERGRPYRTAMSSPAAGAVHCSRLSPHLAWGTVSIREALQAAEARLASLAPDERPAWRGSLASFIGRLHWHCHFIQKLESEPRIEWRTFHPAYEGLRGTDEARLAAWAEGRTGWPFVDACMRMLRATGWLNFRMRAMVMSVASYQLWQDWRPTGLELARLFTDYEPGIHWPQAQMQSGTTGINTLRIYNPIKQGLDHDPDGSFIRRWCPELARRPAALAAHALAPAGDRAGRCRAAASAATIPCRWSTMPKPPAPRATRSGPCAAATALPPPPTRSRRATAAAAAACRNQPSSAPRRGAWTHASSTSAFSVKTRSVCNPA